MHKVLSSDHGDAQRKAQVGVPAAREGRRWFGVSGLGFRV